MSLTSKADAFKKTMGEEGVAALSNLTDGLPLNDAQLTAVFSEEEIKNLKQARDLVDQATEKNKARAEAWKSSGNLLDKFVSNFGFGLF